MSCEYTLRPLFLPRCLPTHWTPGSAPCIEAWPAFSTYDGRVRLASAGLVPPARSPSPRVQQPLSGAPGWRNVWVAFTTTCGRSVYLPQTSLKTPRNVAQL